MGPGKTTVATSSFRVCHKSRNGAYHSADFQFYVSGLWFRSASDKRNSPKNY